MPLPVMERRRERRLPRVSAKGAKRMVRRKFMSERMIVRRVAEDGNRVERTVTEYILADISM